jgi:hypothetical protein
MMDLKGNLQKKGWSQPEIYRVMRSLHRGTEQERYFTQVLFFSTILLVIFSNIFVMVGVLFLAIIMPSWFIMCLMAIFGIIIGIIYDYLMRDIAHIESHHHFVAGSVIPLIAIMNTFVIVYASEGISSDLGLSVNQDPVMSTIIFIIALIIPSFVRRVKQSF